MSGFSPDERRSAWWSTDSRRAMTGKAFEVVAEKIGRAERPDLSEVEIVQMGLRMESTIAAFASEELGELKALGDAVATHPRYPWLKSHGDYIAADNSFLVECKNYNALHIHNYSEPGEPVRVPNADWAQCCHEAACFGVDTVYLCILFGGQRFRTFKLDFSEDEKEGQIQKMAKFWAMVETGTLPDPESVSQCKAAYPVSTEGVAMASLELEQAAKRLAGIKASIKAFEAEEDRLQTAIQRAMGNNAEIQTLDGRTLATWKSAKPSKRFSADLFKDAYPDIYESFVVEQPGSRRFLLKERAE
jgi:predicted phage-related endonuclease